jgi:putative SOS response-associated peptidase YedK
MCGRFTLRASPSVIAEQFALFEVPAFAARFNIAPTQPVAVIRRQNEPPRGDEGTTKQAGDEVEKRSRRRSSVPLLSARRELVWLRWGLIPGWAKDAAIGARLINARAETAAEKPAFRAAFRRRRCLVVADGFYEWQRTGRAKQPCFIRLRDGRPFAFAGLWEAWEAADDSMLETCTILTTDPNELIRPIHDRMPAILSPADYDTWLDTTIEDSGRLLSLLTPYPSDAMQAHPVGDFVNSPAHDSPQCIEPMMQKGNAPFPPRQRGQSAFPGWQ